MKRRICAMLLSAIILGTQGMSAFAEEALIQEETSVGFDTEIVEVNEFIDDEIVEYDLTNVNENYDDDFVIDEVVASDINMLQAVANGKTWKYTVNEDGVTCTITGCVETTGELNIPAVISGYTVTAINKSAFANGGNKYSFTGNLTIPDSVKTIGENAFFKCTGLTGNLTIPNNVESIGSFAFYDCTGFTGNLIIGDNVSIINRSAFYGCTGLTGSMLIPDSVKKIGENAFYNCSGFTGDLTIGNNVIEVGIAAFAGCSGFKGKLTIGNGITSISKYTFSDCSGFPGGLIIPEGIVSIGDSAFSHCTGFSSLALPNSLTTIGDYAFSTCSGLTGNLQLPVNITKIGAAAFYKCSGFTGDLIIPNGLSAIEESAFQGCSGFSGLTISNSVKIIGESSFKDCRGFVGNLIIPASVTTIGRGAFWNCSGFSGNIEIPDSVTTLEDYAFYNCFGFSGTVRIGKGLTTIGSSAFAGCRGLSGDLIIPSNVSRIGSLAFNKAHCNGVSGKLVVPENAKLTASFDYAIFARVENNSNYSIGVYSLPEGYYYVHEGSNQKVDNALSKGKYALTLNGVPVEYNGTTDSSSYGFTKITSLSLNRHENIMRINNSFQLTATTNPQNIDESVLLWNSSDPSVASLERTTGKTISVKTKKVGTAIITVQAADGSNLSDSCKVSVNEDIFPDKLVYYKDNISGFRYLFETPKGENIERTYNYYCDLSWFFKPSYEYQHSLARMSLRVAMTAMDPNGVNKSNKEAAYVKDLMQQLDFTYNDRSIVFEDPDIDDSIAGNTIGTAIGSRKIKNGNEEATLMLVAVRGGGYTKEWAGNFNVGSVETGINTNHNGWDIASDTVIERIKDYVKNENLSDENNLKIWICGFSRGAAVSNLTAAKLNNNRDKNGNTIINNLRKDNIYAYCFECPQNTTNNKAESDDYNNIFNFVNTVDLVPYVAPNHLDWKYKRYGNTIYIGNKGLSSNYDSYEASMEKRYREILYDTSEYRITDDEFNRLVRSSRGSSSTLRHEANKKIVQALAQLIIQPSSYLNYYQNDMMKFGLRVLEDVPKLGNDTMTSAISRLADLSDLVVYIDPIANAIRINGGQKAIKGFLLGEISDKNDEFFRFNHYHTLLLAWLDELGQNDFTTPAWYDFIFLNCPVDVTIKDANGKVVGGFVKDVPQEVENGIAVFIDENGQKVMAVPADMQLTFDIKATDAGTMTYTVERYSVEGITPDKSVSYVDVKIEKDDVFTGTVLNETVTLSNKNNEVLTPDLVYNNGNVEQYIVGTTVTGRGTVEGGGVFNAGEFCQLTAHPENGASFIAWKVDGKIVSRDLVYRFPALSDVSVEAFFSDGKIDDPVQAFVSRMYYIILDRAPETTGLTEWTTKLKNKEIDGASYSVGVVMSDEYKNKNDSDEVYVDKLYRTFLDRQADSSGREYWVHMLKQGYSRKYILRGFVNSEEFTNICKTYGIERGTINLSEKESERSDANLHIDETRVRNYVSRLYDKILNRNPDPSGYDYWTNAIMKREKNAAVVAKIGFFESDEYKNKNRSSREFVTDCYQALMGRTPDEGGLNYWVDKLEKKEMTRAEVIEHGFGHSDEFADILREYGLKMAK